MSRPRKSDLLDEFTGENHAAVRAALADHHFAVEQWLKSPPAGRAYHWRAVESAWRICKEIGAGLDASRQSAALMRAGGKLRSIP